MVKIIQYTLPPGGAGFNSPEFFGGSTLLPLLNGDGELETATSTTLAFDGGSFTGLKGVFSGNFTFQGDAIFGTVKSIHLSYNGQVFQEWQGLDWDAEQITDILDAVDSGDRAAFDVFLAGFDYTFVDHKSGGHNFIMATDGNDRILSQKGAAADSSATVFSFAGNDWIDMRHIATDIYVDSGSGSDMVRTGKGHDQIRSFGGNDTLKGGGGNDNIDGQKGSDRVFGQGGNDSYLTGGAGNDLVNGGGGDDSINDYKGANNMLKGGPDNDQITGRGTLDGGAGNDVLSGRGTFVGGTGNDTVSGTHFRQTDVFDFRLGKSAGFGDDIVQSYTYIVANPKKVDRDALWFDSGVEVTIEKQKKHLLLSATKDGEKIGTVLFQQALSAATPAETGTIIADLYDDMVFL